MAAAAIMDASSTFSSKHPSLAVKRGKSDVGTQHLARWKDKRPQRSHTFSRIEIDSTPTIVNKFEKFNLGRFVFVV